MASALLAASCGPEDTDEDGPGEVGASGGASSGSGGTGQLGSGGASGGSAPGSGGDIAGSGGSGAEAGTGGSPTAEVCHEPTDEAPLITRLPCLLSETGLYEADMSTLAPGVHAFAPQFPLWTDSAEKRRWISIPEGELIDTTDMDFWSFPPGTKVWKEFARDDVRVETRLIEKQTSGAWRMVAYQWRNDQMEADAVPNGVVDASGTEHDIPDADACLRCHGQQPDKVLGFSAIQLSHGPVDPSDANEWTLQRLMDAAMLTSPPSQVFSVPGTDVDKAFFGYVHANCGHCHNPNGSANAQTGLDLWLKVDDLDGTVSEFSVYQGTVDVDIAWLDGDRPAATKRIAPNSLNDSAIYQRFLDKSAPWTMPPLGTEVTDPAGQKAIEDFISSLD